MNQEINGLKEGYWEVYDSNSNYSYKGHYNNGLREGYWEFYYSNINLNCKGHYKNGLTVGYWETYYSDGYLRQEIRI